MSVCHPSAREGMGRVEVVCLINLRRGECHSDYKYLVAVIAKIYFI